MYNIPINPLFLACRKVFLCGRHLYSLQLNELLIRLTNEIILLKIITIMINLLILLLSFTLTFNNIVTLFI